MSQDEIKFTIKNTRAENGKLVVFFAFSNGEENSNTFDAGQSVADIMAWAQARADWFYDRAAQLEQIRIEALAAAQEMQQQGAIE